jgi:hypothetical protein
MFHLSESAPENGGLAGVVCRMMGSDPNPLLFRIFMTTPPLRAPAKREYGDTRTQVPRIRGVARLLMIQLVPADMTLGIRENDSEFRNPSWFSVHLCTTWYNLLYKG